MKRYDLTWAQVDSMLDTFLSTYTMNPPPLPLFGVPRGGLIVAQRAALRYPGQFRVVDSPHEATLIVDDILDSGRTKARYETLRPGVPFVPLVVKQSADEWYSFPWEEKGETAEDNITRLLEAIGEDPNRAGLKDTPARVLRALREQTAGMKEDPAIPLARTFDEDCDDMVILRGIRFSSLCEHHLLPFNGEVTIGYLPRGKVVGISKLARVASIFARRLQVQERMTADIAKAVEAHLHPLGVGVIVRAHHSCMGCRGVLQPDADLLTSSLLGVFRDGEARREFLALANGRE